MKENNKDIGTRIKELREIYEISANEVSKELGINKEEYLEYENGKKEIPANLLYEISLKFNVDMGLLITGEETRMRIFTVTRKGEGSIVERRKEYSYENLADKFIHKKTEPFIVTVEPNSHEKPDTNTHPGQEFNYILEGSIKFFIKENEIILNEGDSIYFDSRYQHSMKALNNKTAKFLAFICE
ncbi:helix-turn-helix domain-containing protein [Methanobrevibacter curvatus]|uniref:Cupin domain protein n=1 Tax=Methanobrevibacter curvatus TaxID=49547 RepID=A0A166AMP1_9EURY|nr:cupin domain-containing protein [Methanobrevibacter curvatus]KZX12234.1 cupin domain protein [Methanobrevibacter curvatus]